MKTITSWVSIVACLLCMTSCEKEEGYPQTLQKASFIEGTTRMFTNRGEVFDTSIINSYIRRFQDDLYMIWKIRPSLDSNFLEYDKCRFKIMLVSKSRLNILYDDGKVQPYNLQRQNRALYLVKDTLVTTSFLFDYEWLKFKPIIVKTEPAFPAGTIITFKPSIFVYETNGEMQFPIVSCIANRIPHTSLSQGYSTWYLRQNNTISEAFLDKITTTTQSTDTIVFKESRIVFKAGSIKE